MNLSKKKSKQEVIPLIEQPKSEIPEEEAKPETQNPIIPVLQTKKHLEFPYKLAIFLLILNTVVFSLWGIQAQLGIPITSIADIPLWRIVIIIDIITIIHLTFKLCFHFLFQLLTKLVLNDFLLHLFYHISPYEHTMAIGGAAVVTLSIYWVALLPIVRLETSLFLWSLVSTYFALSLVHAGREAITKIVEYWTFREMRHSIYEVVWKELIFREFEKKILEKSVDVVVNVKFEEDLSLLGKSQSVLVEEMTHLVDDVEMTPDDAAEKIVRENIFKGNKVNYTKDDIKDTFGHISSRVWKIMNHNKDGVCKIGDFKTLLLSVWKQRKDLQSWVKSRSLLITITNQLTQFLYWIIVLFIFLALFVEQFYSIPWNTLLASCGTVLLALSFAYGKVLQDLFSSLALIFLVKPYTVGDSIRIGDSTDTLEVEEVRVLATFFQHEAGYEVCIPNAVLAASKITNLNKGLQVSTTVTLQISIQTTQDQLSVLNDKIQKYISTRDLFSMVSLRVDSTDSTGNFFNVNLFVKFRKRILFTDDEWRRELSFLVVEVHQEINEMGKGSSKEPLIHL